MKSKGLKSFKRKMENGRIKGTLLMEIAEDIVDIIGNAKLYRDLKKRK